MKTNGTSSDSYERFGNEHEKGWGYWDKIVAQKFGKLGNHPAECTENGHAEIVRFMDIEFQVETATEADVIAGILNIGVAAILQADKEKNETR